MLTIHRARLVRRTPGGEPLPGHALVVDGDRIAAIGPYEELLGEYGGRARVREWDGELTPGRHESGARTLLESVYHPDDPYEVDELGSAPLTGEAVAALEMTDTRWGQSARRALQKLLATGTTGLTGPFTRPRVRTVVSRSGLRVLPPGGPAAPPPLTPGGRADFAVFAGPDTPGGEYARCLVTVIAGRLVHRRA
ncbi:imidazolonepropionase-like domain-containing protein [Streptomyces xinghaiensis]|uniref:imidazolonepropionase-like domain-containing protein n=1 Tax=Streptomyces xinghaiensis TaxID=1038928 RepID=UPI00379AD160